MNKSKFKVDFQGYITLGYLSIVVIGMLFDYQYYSLFSINIFEYSDILDFILAPAKNLEVIIFALVSLLIVLLAIKLDRNWAKNRPKSYKRFNPGAGKRWMEKNRPIYYAISILAYLYLSATLYAQRQMNIFNRTPRSIEIKFESDGTPLEGHLIGKNSDYIFLQTKDSTVKAIPILTDVQEITIGKPE